MTSTGATSQIWTIGHWVTDTETFVRTLQDAQIEVLVDIRAIPGSRRSPHFSADTMPSWLGEAGIEYLHLPELGGRRSKQHEVPAEANAGWQNTSFKNYADYTLTPAFQDGLTRLTELAQERNTCLMCGEPVPWRCHRNLIANILTARGWAVWHLFANATPKRHELGAWGAKPLVDEEGTITYPPDQGRAS